MLCAHILKINFSPKDVGTGTVQYIKRFGSGHAKPHSTKYLSIFGLKRPELGIGSKGRQRINFLWRLGKFKLNLRGMNYKGHFNASSSCLNTSVLKILLRTCAQYKFESVNAKDC